MKIFDNKLSNFITSCIDRAYDVYDEDLVNNYKDNREQLRGWFWKCINSKD